MDNKNTHDLLKKEPIVALIFLIGIWMFSIFLGTTIFQGLLLFYDIPDIAALQNLIKDENATKKPLNLMKWGLAIANGFAYLVPSCIFTLVLYRRNAGAFLLLNKVPQLKNIGLSLALIIASYGIISFIYYYNTTLIPAEYVNKDVLGLEQLMLKMDNGFDLLFNLLVFSCIAGIGEELFFRGIVQQYIIEWTKNIWIGVLSTGILFTVVHFQLEGFIPRFLLSVLFSLCVVITGNLWISVFMHMFFNSLPFFVNYFSSSDIISVDKVQQVPLSYALFSLLCTFLLWITFVNVNKKYVKI